jgi:hypothetical protein
MATSGGLMMAVKDWMPSRRLLGRRYANQPNLVWMMGGYSNPDPRHPSSLKSLRISPSFGKLMTED